MMEKTHNSNESFVSGVQPLFHGPITSCYLEPVTGTIRARYKTSRRCLSKSSSQGGVLKSGRKLEKGWEELTARDGEQEDAQFDKSTEGTYVSALVEG